LAGFVGLGVAVPSILAGIFLNLKNKLIFSFLKKKFKNDLRRNNSRIQNMNGSV
jgi:hypothetical protein